MKIYKYYRGKVHELEVKETAKCYIAEKCELAFDCRTHFFKKDGICLNPLEAVREAINTRLTSKGIHEDRLNIINSDLEHLKGWEDFYKTESEKTSG